MKWIFTCVMSLLFTASSPFLSANNLSRADLTQFDQPLLLGDWYLLNPNPEQSSENFRVIKLSLASDYHFSIDIQRKISVLTTGMALILQMRKPLFSA